MIPHEYRIPYKYGDTIRIKPLYDIHYGNKYCDTRALNAYLSDCDDKTYIIGGGDSIDAVITKDIKRYMKHSDGTDTDAVIDEQVDGLHKILAPYKDNIIGMMDGNHEHTMVKYHGTNPIKRLCEKLECTHLGYSFLMKMFFRESDGRGRSVVIRAHHGWGGGSRTQGGEITKYSKDMANYEADIFLYGHGHKLQSNRTVKFGVSGKKIVSKPQYLFLCGSFLKSFSLTTDATYAEVAGYPPIEVGGINISIKPDSKWLKIESDV